MLAEAADTAPFFHNNAVETIEGSVDFYNSTEFNGSSAGLLVSGATGSGISLTAGEVEQVGAFLRAINALENVRSTLDVLDRALDYPLANAQVRRLLRIGRADIQDAIEVLAGARLHPVARIHLATAKALTTSAIRRVRFKALRNRLIKLAERLKCES